MATKKPLTVPQNGTQPAEIKTPMDNMISGTTTKKSTLKRPTSFSLSPEVLIQFKAGCAYQGRPMSDVIEELMIQFVLQNKP